MFGTLGHWALASSVGAGIVPILATSGEGAGTIVAIGLLAMIGAAIVEVVPFHIWKASHMIMWPIFLLAALNTFFTAGPPVRQICYFRSRPLAAGLSDVSRQAAQLPQLDVIARHAQQQEVITSEHKDDLIRDMPTIAQVYLCGPNGIKALVI